MQSCGNKGNELVLKHVGAGAETEVCLASPQESSIGVNPFSKFQLIAPCCFWRNSPRSFVIGRSKPLADRRNSKREPFLISNFGSKPMKKNFVAPVAFAVLIMVVAPMIGHAQTLIGNGQANSGANGLHVYQVTGSTGYSSYGEQAVSLGDGAGVGGQVYTWAAISLGFAHQKGNHTFRINYTPSYSGIVENTKLQSFNQNMSFELRERLKPQWTFYIRGSVDDSSVQQFLFRPGSASQLITDGQPDQLASTVIGAPSEVVAVNSPLQNTIYGRRMLTFGGQTGIRYRYSPRLSISAGGGFSQTQSRDKEQSTITRTVVPRSRVVEGSLDVAYSLDARSAIGVSAATINTDSAFGNAQFSTFTGSYGRKLGMHWFGQVAGGVGTVQTGKTLGSTPTGASRVLGASFGYQDSSQAFVVSYNRTVGDTYGFVAGSTTGFIGTWNYRRPGTAWGLVASGGQQELKGGPVGGFTTWHSTAGLTRVLGRQFNLSVEYAYLRDAIRPKSAFDDFETHIIRLTVSWIPLLGEIGGPTKGTR